MGLGRRDLSPLTLTKGLVDEQGALCSRADDNGTVLAAIGSPDNIRGGGRLGAAGNNQLVVLSGGEVLGVRRQAVVEREGVPGGVEEGSILVGVDVLTVWQLSFARVSLAWENLLSRGH